ncbi:MAG: hypothetical protein KDK70_05390 [Myxococcales bacterium]|nr:hypothetical protein [Myxococcales bacterium]
MTEIVRDQSGIAYELRPPRYDDEDLMDLPVRDVLDRLHHVDDVLGNHQNRDAMAAALAEVGRVSLARRLEFDELRAEVEQALREGVLRIAPHEVERRPVSDLVPDQAAPLVDDDDDDP